MAGFREFVGETERNGGGGWTECWRCAETSRDLLRADDTSARLYRSANRQVQPDLDGFFTENKPAEGGAEPFPLEGRPELWRCPEIQRKFRRLTSWIGGSCGF